MSGKTMTLKVTMSGGSVTKAAERTESEELPFRTVRYYAFVSPSECKGGTTGIELKADGTTLLQSSVPSSDEDMLGADAEYAVCSVVGGCADGGGALADELSGLGEGRTFGIDCITADGGRVPLSAVGSLSDGVLTLSASFPADARMAVVTCGGSDAAAVELKCRDEEAGESVTCDATGCIETVALESAGYDGAYARDMPGVTSPVRTFPPLPPAERLRAFGKVLVPYGYGRVSAVKNEETLTERAADGVTRVWAADDGTLAYVANGRAFMCRGSADIACADGTDAVLTGSGEDAVMHVLGGGTVRGYGAEGAIYSRASSALALSSSGGNVFDLTSSGVDTYTADGTFAGHAGHGLDAESAVSRSPGAFAVRTSAESGGALAVVTPSYVRVIEDAEALDGTLGAVRTGSGIRIADFSGAGERDVGEADSEEFAFADALYSVSEGGRITRRAAVAKRVLLTGAAFVSGSVYEVAGTKRARDAATVTVTVGGG